MLMRCYVDITIFPYKSTQACLLQGIKHCCFLSCFRLLSSWRILLCSIFNISEALFVDKLENSSPCSTHSTTMRAIHVSSQLSILPLQHNYLWYYNLYIYIYTWTVQKSDDKIDRFVFTSANIWTSLCFFFFFSRIILLSLMHSHHLSPTILVTSTSYSQAHCLWCQLKQKKVATGNI